MQNLFSENDQKIIINTGRKSLFHNINEICGIISSEGKVICKLTNHKEIPLHHNLATLKLFLLSHHFIEIGEDVLINAKQIQTIRDTGDGLKIYTKCNVVIRVHENYKHLLDTKLMEYQLM